jgi:hypothetical protein
MQYESKGLIYNFQIAKVPLYEKLKVFITFYREFYDIGEHSSFDIINGRVKWTKTNLPKDVKYYIERRVRLMAFV